MASKQSEEEMREMADHCGDVTAEQSVVMWPFPSYYFDLAMGKLVSNRDSAFSQQLSIPA